MKILSIETSCDETGIALLDASGGLKNPRFKILKNLVASQIKIHRPFGGVVPNLAKREHLKNLPLLWERLRGEEGGGMEKKIDIIAVTVGPGLEPALWTGIEFAKKNTEIPSPFSPLSSPSSHRREPSRRPSLQFLASVKILKGLYLPTHYSPLVPVSRDRAHRLRRTHDFAPHGIVLEMGAAWRDARRRGRRGIR